MPSTRRSVARLISSGGFDSIRQDIIDGLDSAQAEANGWDAVVKATLPVSAVVRTSDTVVTITLPAFVTYDITAPETITATVPASAVVAASAVIATPTFAVTATGNQLVTPSTLSLTISLFAPTVTATNPQTVTPGTLSLTITAFAPTVTTTSHYLVLRDDFSSFDSSVWTKLDRINSDAIEWDLADNVNIDTGVLVIDGKFESFGGADYTGGSIQWTYLAYQFGRLKISAKFPPATGAIAAVWLLGTNSQLGHVIDANFPGIDWPNYGSDEIDIAEMLNGHQTDMNQQLHNDIGNDGGEVALGFNSTTGFHLYELDWQDGVLTWYVDGSQTKQITGSHVYDSPKFLILSLSVGGAGGTPDSGDFPTTFEIDYVEVTTDTPYIVPIPMALAITTYAPSVLVQNNQLVTPSTLSITLAFFAPTVAVSNNQLVTPAALALTISLFAPTVSATANQVVTPDLLALVITTFVPTVTGGAGLTVTPSTLALTITAFAPTVVTPVLVTPGTLALTITTFAPSVGQPIQVTPSILALVITTFVPTVATPVTATPTTLALILTTFAPTVTTPVLATPTTLALVTATFAPTVTATGNVNLTPAVLALVLAFYAPVVTGVVTTIRRQVNLTGRQSTYDLIGRESRPDLDGRV